MTVLVDYKAFQTKLNAGYYRDAPISEAEAAEAFHALVGYVSLLLEINAGLALK